ncbi:serine/threonine-protein kinase ULK3-like [Acanthaster planci]|uniref:Serine/threonine-protein kinase ULK3 n=1 Tax=Acanthaster planci TaxID=133434 RepID=A0A8B7Z218_ACAPL|nr:serine/threonine-protein kinase ULK3-like [Acanthaster planci]XP_022097436.1 serine/threonine-protein kinase ULK3-like [Acanthaster planci]
MAASSAKQPKLNGFIFTEKLGSGSYATVYKAYRKGQQREVVAVKCVLKSSLSKNSVENLLTEIEILKHIKHEHIVELRDFQWDDSYIYLIMEYCSGGDMSHFVRTKQALPEQTVRVFVRQIASALHHLQLENITHMDLKPQNLLLSNSYDPVLKLADFGFALYMTEDVRADSLRGSPLYMAPEIICEGRYDAKVDLWSVGVIMFECLFGHAPFASKTFTELAEKIRSSKPVQIPDTIPISDRCRDLLLKLLQRDPADRIDFPDFFQHSFIDLEHIPSTESLKKAKALVIQAVEKDSSGDIKAAIQLYCESLQYFLPAIQFEKDAQRKEVLRAKVQEYMARAEDLKEMLKPKSQAVPRMPESPQDGQQIPDVFLLDKLANGHQNLQIALEIAHEAEMQDAKENYEAAFKLYQDSLEQLIVILQHEPRGKRREILNNEVQRYMARAESVKQFIEVRRIPMKQESINEVLKMDGRKNACSIQ